MGAAGITTMPVAGGVGVGKASSSAKVLRLALAAAVVLSLLVVAVAAIPAPLVPRQVSGLAYEHRETLIVWGTTVTIGGALGLLIALLGS
jgi:hypothetical protein